MQALKSAIEELNKEALKRLIRALKDDPASHARMREALGDPLIYGVLRFHGLVKEPLHARIEKALDEVRPFMATHGGNVELVAVKPPDTVEIRLTGSCHGCPASSQTLTEGVEKAIHAHCPEIVHINQVSKGASESQHGSVKNGESVVHFISPFALHAKSGWVDAASLDEIPEGGVIERKIKGRSMLLSKQGNRVSCFDNSCAHLGMPLKMGEVRGGVIPGLVTLNVPTGITPCGEGLAVADAWNHRVLIWNRLPRDHNTPADLVLGQQDFSSMQANRGSVEPTADSLFWPYGIHWDGARLWIADSGNRRVLMWNGLPTHNGQAADLVLGQQGFTCRDENAGGESSASSMRWPHGLALWQGRLCVSDAGNNRIMVWDTVPAQNNIPCDHILGQNDFSLVDNNQSLYRPNEASLNMPYGCAATGGWLMAADTANSRLIAWHADDCHTGAAARALTAQPDFRTEGDNRWQLPAHDSLCWPYGVMHCAGQVVVADSGNNRVLLWRLAEELAP